MSLNENFGLTDNEVKVALCALKVMLVDGKVEKGHLARLTGHSNADSAIRVWYIAKNKLSNTGATSESATSSLVDVDTPTKGPKETATKSTQTETKKTATKSTQTETEEEDQASGMEAEADEN